MNCVYMYMHTEYLINIFFIREIQTMKANKLYKKSFNFNTGQFSIIWIILYSRLLALPVLKTNAWNKLINTFEIKLKNFKIWFIQFHESRINFDTAHGTRFTVFKFQTCVHAWCCQIAQSTHE
jgi:hypothetical protein